jgi:hypothetical protein
MSNTDLSAAQAANFMNAAACGIQSLSVSTEQAGRVMERLAATIRNNREQGLTTGPGEWPDKFTLLNRYAYLLND